MEPLQKRFSGAEWVVYGGFEYDVVTMEGLVGLIVRAGWSRAVGAGVRQVVFSSNGQLVAAALGLGDGPEGVVLDAADGQEVASFASRALSAGGVAWTSAETLVAVLLDDLGWSLVEWRLDGTVRRLVELRGNGYSNVLLHPEGRWLALVSDGVEVFDLSAEDVPMVWSRKAQQPLGCRAAWDASGKLWVSNLAGGALLAFSAAGEELLSLDGPSEAGGTDVLVVDRGHLYATGLPGPGAVLYELASGERVQPRFFGPRRRGVYLTTPVTDTFLELSGTPCVLDLAAPEVREAGTLFDSVANEVHRFEDHYVMGSVAGDVAVVHLEEE